ncbi:MAG: EamA family transporter [Verrucomicrobia bacterium]|nr:EamA family transporter [Verrucomicrobiota bacterium]
MLHSADMDRWKLYAFAAAVFAGLTSVIAKSGLKTLGADVGLAVRTAFVFSFIMLNTFLWTGTGKTAAALSTAGWRSIGLLALSGLTTTLSWVCYYRAMHEGTVSYVSLVDKGSILVTLVLSVLLLGEPFTWRMVVGAMLIIGGLLVLAGGK